MSDTNGGGSNDKMPSGNTDGPPHGAHGSSESTAGGPRMDRGVEWWGAPAASSSSDEPVDVSTYAPVSIPALVVETPPPAASSDGKPKRDRKGRKVAVVSVIVVGLLGLAVIGKFGYDVFFHGGASSPEAAVEELANAIESQDPLLAASVINPDEARLMNDFVGSFGSSAKAAGAASFGEPQPGLELSVKGLRTRSDELAPDVARVEVRNGSIEASVKREELPEVLQADSVMSETKMSGRADVDDLGEDFDDTLSLIAVKVNHGWYISPTLTAADMYWQFWSHRSTDDGVEPPEPDYDAYGDVDSFADGSPSPEDAVYDMADAIASADPDSIAELLPSDEAQFALVFQESIAQIFEDEGVSENEFKVDDLDVEESDLPGGMRRLTVLNAKAKVSDDEVVELNGASLCEYYVDADCEEGDDWFGRENTAFHKALARQLDGGWSLVVREVDHGWKLDPIATVFDNARRLSPMVTPAWIRSFVGSTSGDAIAVPPNKATPIKYDEAGYAVVELPIAKSPQLTAVRLSSVSSPSSSGDSDGLYNAAFAQNIYLDSAPEGGAEVGLLSSDDLPLDCKPGTKCRFGMGGPMNTLSQASVLVEPLEPISAVEGKEVSGAFGSSGVAILRMEGMDEYSTVELTAKFADDAYVGGNGWEAGTQGTEVLDYSDVDIGQNTLVMYGKPSSGFALQFMPVRSGFGSELNSTVTTNVPPGESTISYSFGSGDNTIELSWDQYADLDIGLSGQSCSDSSSSTEYGGSVYLSCFGPDAGTVTIHNLSSTNVTATLSVALE